ncbi:MAG: hypothetical protein Q4D53_06520 [Leptotrichiaceae bacterium]|nr:hypothetical protein [Leptotrichiaceae bacterium]
MEKRLYKLSFRNIKELNNISLNFGNVRNILNSKISTEKTGKTIINSNPDLTYEISDREKQREINSFLSEQIIKIQKRKKAIFETFIKDKDSIPEKGNDNREADYIISALDFYNFFGGENIVIEENDRDLEEYYTEISKEIADRLYEIYEKRYDNYKNRNSENEYNKKWYSINAKIANWKREINHSYIFMKIFNFIKRNFQYEIPYIETDEKRNVKIKYKKEEFLAEIPIMNSLNLNFSENNTDTGDDKNLEFIEKNVRKARLAFERTKGNILIPEALFHKDDGVFKVTGTLSENGELVTNEISKKEIFKKLIYKKFTEIMKDKLTVKEEEGQSVGYYAVNIKLYNININRINFMNVIKSVVFKEIIDELRPYIVGIYDKNGNNIKKSIKLNDMKKISEITDYKKEQIELLFRNKERDYFRKIEEKYLKLEKKYAGNTVNEEIKKKIKADIRQNIKKEKESYFQRMKEIKKKMDRNLAEFERKNKDLSVNFKVKSLRKKQEGKFKIKDRVIGIFLNDIYNMINKYENFYMKKNKRECKNINKNTLRRNSEKTENTHEEKLIFVDRDFLFIKVFTELSRKFNFVVPLLGEYGEKISDRFVTIIFFNDINNVNSFLDNIVYSATDIHIIKDKYKVFRKSGIKKEMIFLSSEGKVERKKVTYLEYLDYKYRKKIKINRENPFEITSENVSAYGEACPNSFKYHRILGENIKYLFININFNKELKINSLLFKNYKQFINIMLILDGVINSGNKILKDENGKEIILRNFITHSSSFDIYINEKYIETTHYNIDINDETYRTETVNQRLEKILAEI